MNTPFTGAPLPEHQRVVFQSLAGVDEFVHEREQWAESGAHLMAIRRTDRGADTTVIAELIARSVWDTGTGDVDALSLWVRALPDRPPAGAKPAPDVIAAGLCATAWAVRGEDLSERERAAGPGGLDVENHPARYTIRITFAVDTAGTVYEIKRRQGSDILDLTLYDTPPQGGLPPVLDRVLRALRDGTVRP